MRQRRGLMVIGLVVGAIAGGAGTVAAQESGGKPWPGTITRTEVFNGTSNGRRISYRRTERWTQFVAKQEDEETAFFETRWTLEISRREDDDRCTTIIEAHGQDRYDSLTFDVNALDGSSYQIYSAGTGEVPSVTGSMRHTCRGEEAVTLPYEADASWLPAAGIQIPADLLPPGVPAQSTSTAPPGTTVSGKFDPSHPTLLRGRGTYRAEGGTVVTTAWSLSRTSDCGNETEVKALVQHETNRIRTLEAEAPAPEADAAAPQITRNRVLSAQAVGDALAAAAGGPDSITLRDANAGESGGVRRFGIRVSRDGVILPSLDAIRREIETTCVPDGAVEGAPVLLLGAVQWTGESFRINLRVVDTETGVVKNSVTDGGRGGAAELQQALDGAFANLLAR